MPKKPFVHALVAALYIIVIVTVIFALEGRFPEEDTIFAPMAMLSLLTLSVAFTGYVFVSWPLMLYVEGKKTEAVSFFLKTVAIFAVFTATFFILMALGLFPQSGFN